MNKDPAKRAPKAKTEEDHSKVVDKPPKVCWQSIIVLVFAAIIVIYAAVAPNVEDTKRVFSIIMMILWATLWAIVLWVIWKDGKSLSSWLMLIVPIALMIVFFVLVVILNVDAVL